MLAILIIDHIQSENWLNLTLLKIDVTFYYNHSDSFRKGTETISSV